MKTKGVKHRHKFDHETAVPDPAVFGVKLEALRKACLSMSDAARTLGPRYGIASYSYLVRGKTATSDEALFGDRFFFALISTSWGGWDIYWGYMPNQWNKIPKDNDLMKVSSSYAEIKILFLQHAAAFWAGYLSHVKCKDKDIARVLATTKPVLGELAKLIKASVWKPADDSMDPPQDSLRTQKTPKE